MTDYLDKVNNAIKKYDVRNIKTIVQEALDNGVKAQSILDDAMIPARLAVSRACCSRFWPYDERYFILPISRINSGCSP